MTDKIEIRPVKQWAVLDGGQIRHPISLYYSKKDGESWFSASYGYDFIEVTIVPTAEFERMKEALQDCLKEFRGLNDPTYPYLDLKDIIVNLDVLISSLSPSKDKV